MRITNLALLLIVALTTAVVQAEQVYWLKENVQSLMEYEDFPTGEEAIKIIPDDDPLANLKRIDVLHTLISLTDFYPVFEPGKWQELARGYKQDFKEMGGKWPLDKEDQLTLEQDGFMAYPIVMQTYFPEAFKLKPTSDGSHKQEAALRATKYAVGVLLGLLGLAIFVRRLRKQ